MDRMNVKTEKDAEIELLETYEKFCKGDGKDPDVVDDLMWLANFIGANRPEFKFKSVKYLIETIEKERADGNI